MAVVRFRPARALLFTVRIFLLILGGIGLFLTVLPTTPFILLIAWCFLKSSPKAHRGLYRQPYLGKALKKWDHHRSVSRRSKTVAILRILVSAIFVWIKVNGLVLRIFVLFILFAVSTFIATRNERLDG